MRIPRSLIQMDIHEHSLIKILRSVHKVVEHVVGQRGYLVVGCHVNGLFVRLAHAHVIESDSQRTDADLGHFLEIHGRLGQDASVDPLIEIHPPLDSGFALAS